MEEARVIQDLRESVVTALIDWTVDSKQSYRPTLVYNNHLVGENILGHLLQELKTCDEFQFSVAFVSDDGLLALLPGLDNALDRHVKGRILTGTYLTFNQPKAFERLLNYPNIEVRIFNGDFHAKGYFFKHGETTRLLVGSANLTASALKENEEWSLAVTSTDEGKLVRDAQREFDRLWSHEQTSPLSKDWIDAYRVEYEKYHRERVATFYYTPRDELIQPNVMQKNAMAGLAQLRDEGESRALLISATGTGKTYLSAFDVRVYEPHKVLYVVHRSKIARKSMQSFMNVLPNEKYTFGLFSGEQKDVEPRCIFATVQTISRQENLERFSRDAFDYIIIDEVHRAGAESYLRLIDYFTPKFLLGMSATPDRTDDFDIYALFNHNIAYEIRLNDALEFNLLVPFHYFGVGEIDVDGVPLDEKSKFSDLVSDERVRHIFDAVTKYGYSGDRVRGLVFCSRNREATELSNKFNSLGYRTVALSGSTSEAVRDNAIERLEQAENDENALDYIFTVDIFNEGIDIPSVNQIVMLRPTESSIIFVQQLGRGLRTDEGKEYLVVIDFIGNYENNYLIPVALFGDKTRSKERLRKLMSNGSAEIPGSSTVSFDRIATERIIQNINSTNFSTVSELKGAYKPLKQKLGRIPSLVDFFNHGEIDPILFFSNKSLGTYHSFLSKYELEYQVQLTDEQVKILLFVSRELANGKRKAELLLIKELMEEGDILLPVFEQRLSAASPELSRESIHAQAISAVNVLSLHFFTASVQEKYVPVCSMQDSIVKRSVQLSTALYSDDFIVELYDVVELGLKLNERDYKEGFNNRPFTLYQRYSRKDACRLACWDHDESSTVYGYTFKTNDWLIFVTYKKAEDIAEATKYLDHFETEETFRWMSRHGLTMESKEAVLLQKYDAGNTRIHLFIKKEDGEGQDHYYMGTVQPEELGETRIRNDKGKFEPVLSVRFHLDHEVRRDIYEHLVND